MIDSRLEMCYTAIIVFIGLIYLFETPMTSNNTRPTILSEFLKYLAANSRPENERLPALACLSQELGLSVAILREQLEVARGLGLVEVKPKTGIRPLPYSFRPAVLQSLNYAMAIDPAAFQTYSDLRNHIEASYWDQAVRLLTPEDHRHLQHLVDEAFKKLYGHPIQIPQSEHRELHLSIYRRLNNKFVLGILEAYWEVYEAVGLSMYNDFTYLEKVWQYHQSMVEAISKGEFSEGYHALMDHMGLLNQRPVSIFEHQQD
jgi:DNA-binding FadR family transcriptional regulator